MGVLLVLVTLGSWLFIVAENPVLTDNQDVTGMALPPHPCFGALGRSGRDQFCLCSVLYIQAAERWI